MENSRPNMKDLQGATEQEINKAFDEYRKGCRWFQSALNKFDITQDRKRTLGGKIHIFCFYGQS